MSKIEDERYLKRTRATWLAEKLDINFAKAHAIVNHLIPVSPMEQKKISEAIKSDMRAPIYKSHTKRKI
ncbi:MAG: hypothetical protein PVF73_04535 [Bacteroidales bacterium]|jgi:hypothetical protein